MGKMRIFSLDAGRKYFSINKIKQIIELLSNTGYTHLHLILANEGFRLILDDMSINEFESEKVKEALNFGNKEYKKLKNISFEGDSSINQDEMIDLINYAKEKSIDIIPCLNSPGHMHTLVSAMKFLEIDKGFEYRGKHSISTFNILNENAVKFMTSLINKYSKFFKQLGIEYFNFGCDELANELTEFKTYEILQDNGNYQKLLDYCNQLSSIIKSNGLKPICFSDAIYYRDKTDYIFDKDIIIGLWTTGWPGYEVAKSTTFEKMGHEIININDKWYYVLGRETKEDGICNRQNALKNINGEIKFDVNVGPNVNTIGSMIALWCDEPKEEYEFNKLKELLVDFSKNNF